MCSRMESPQVSGLFCLHRPSGYRSAITDSQNSCVDSGSLTLAGLHDKHFTFQSQWQPPVGSLKQEFSMLSFTRAEDDTQLRGRAFA